MFDPKIEFLMSEVNEDKTSGDFREMGERLAQEVITFVKKKMDKASRHGNLSDIKISFVGHSIGNVIIRTALAGNTSSLCAMFSDQFVVQHLRFEVLFCRNHYGAIFEVPAYLRLGIWSTLGLSL